MMIRNDDYSQQHYIERLALKELKKEYKRPYYDRDISEVSIEAAIDCITDWLVLAEIFDKYEVKLIKKGGDIE